MSSQSILDVIINYLFGDLIKSIIPYIIASIVGFILALAIFFGFAPVSNRKKYINSPSLLWMHDFANFKRMISPWWLKLVYLIVLCTNTVTAIVMLFDNFWWGIFCLTLGNVLSRMFYEILQVIYSIYKNLNIITDEITGRSTDISSNVNAFQFFGDMGRQIKNKSQDIRNRFEADTTVICSNCGEQVGSTSAFCSKCGTKASESQLPVQKPISAFCKNCGQAMSGAALFCAKCGTKQ